ncbi:MAG TPA: bifunctional diguanylate cyclase/phosphodiesterase [Sphingomicrobium sp.]
MVAEPHPPTLYASRPTPRLANQLSYMAMAVLITVAVVAITGLYWSTRQSDAVSVERQVRVARHSIDITLDELALQQETVAVWDESALEMAKASPNRQWLFDNVGSWLHRIFAHDAGFLLNGRDQLVQAVDEGNLIPPDRYDVLRPQLQPVIDAVRGRVRVLNGKHDRLPGEALAANSTVRTTPRAIHSTRLLMLGGRPAAVSAMLIKPSTPDYAKPSPKWPILISVRYLDASFLDELQSRYVIDRPHFSVWPDHRSGEAAVDVRTQSGNRLGYLIWTPELPGSRILRTLLPTVVASLAILALLMTALTRSLTQTLNERAAFEARAAHLAYHDSLTGLPNRALLNERLQHALSALHRGGKLSLLLIDLDRFKRINDTLGHLAGDQLIRDFAARLSRLIRRGDTVARLGGDEFAVLLCENWEFQEIDELCSAIIALFDVPFTLLDTQVFGGASIGAVHASASTRDATELLRRADVALYRAKADGRGCARVYDSGMDENNQIRARLEADLREGLEAGQFAVWHQPQVDREKRLVGQELLLRWNHPLLGCVGAQDIIPLAEETGLILPIGEWMLDQAAKIAAASPELFTAVNLSPLQLAEPGFAERLIDTFAAHGVDFGRVELEVTEQVMLDRTTAAMSNLWTIREAGFRIALDDFGTGYSSLSYLRQLAVDKIKIDRSFVADLQDSRDARAIVAAIVTLGRAIGLTVSAEGIETEEQAEILVAAGCDQLQGFLFGMPQLFAAAELGRLAG